MIGESKSIEEIFKPFFEDYKKSEKKSYLSYVVTSRDRQGNKASNPHALPGNAIDLTLRVGKEYAPIKEYNDLLKFMFDGWKYRAGMDNTPMTTKKGVPGNVHVHIDLGRNRPVGQKLPFFFIEDNGVFKFAITNKGQIV